MSAKYYYELINEKKARLLRVYSKSGELSIPNEIDGYLITEIGEYCFAPQNKYLSKHKYRIAYGKDTTSEDYLLELAGNNVVEICLPDEVEKIGNNAFYNCKRLKHLLVGKNLEEIGSDAFMNCLQLDQISIDKDITQRSCLKQLLAQVSWNVEIDFPIKDGERGVFFFPEYYEAYDEIGPAHIFELSLSGEGFRTRQCFWEQAFLIAEYDAIFPKAVVEEPEKNLFRMACNRICFPTALNEAEKKQYKDFLISHQSLLEKQILTSEIYDAEQKKYRLMRLTSEKCIEEETLKHLIEVASQKGYGELTTLLLKWKKDFFQKQSSRYAFDDF